MEKKAAQPNRVLACTWRPLSPLLWAGLRRWDSQKEQRPGPESWASVLPGPLAAGPLCDLAVGASSTGPCAFSLRLKGWSFSSGPKIYLVVVMELKGADEA